MDVFNIYRWLIKTKSSTFYLINWIISFLISFVNNHVFFWFAVCEAKIFAVRKFLCRQTFARLFCVQASGAFAEIFCWKRKIFVGKNAKRLKNFFAVRKNFFHVHLKKWAWRGEFFGGTKKEGSPSALCKSPRRAFWNVLYEAKPCQNFKKVRFCQTLPFASMKQVHSVLALGRLGECFNGRE